MKRALAVAFLPLVVAAQAGAQERLPSFASTVPAGWATDRYEPSAFDLVPVFQGRTNVLRIGISENDQQGMRPGPFADAFYNTQGRQIGIDGLGVTTAAGTRLSADLWVDQSWSSGTAGFRRTDMWGRLGLVNSAAESNVDYPILGFTNYGGNARFRYYDSQIGWVDLSNTVNFGAWNSLSLEFTGTGVNAYVNGVLAHSDLTLASPQTQRLTTAFMQAYNFGDDFGSNTSMNYEAHWANAASTVVPEPSTYALMGAGLAGLFMVQRRRRRVS